MMNPSAPGGSAPPMPVSMRQSQYFRFAYPEGWTLNEHTNGLFLNAPDGSAAIMHVGLVGMLQPFTPDQFVCHVLAMHQMFQPRFLSGQPIQPPPGCSSAGMFELTYVTNGIPCQGHVVSYIALGYNQCNGSMTLSASSVQGWPAVRNWLPQVAAHVQPGGMQTYMAGQVAADNQRSTAEFGQRLSEYNSWSQNLQQQTTNERWQSQDRNNFHFRENLGNVSTFDNPYLSRPVELPTTYSHYWVNRQGQIVGSNDPGYDPRVGSTQDWIPMPRTRP